MRIIAMIEPIPIDNTRASASQVQEVGVETDDYQAGVSAVRAQVPEGWRVMNLPRQAD